LSIPAYVRLLEAIVVEVAEAPRRDFSLLDQLFDAAIVCSSG
jgi:hypothetical protein